MSDNELLVSIDDHLNAIEYFLSLTNNDSRNIELHTRQLKNNAQELISGDILTRQAINETNYKTSVYLGCINLILMVTLILSLLPARKGVLKKQ